MLQFIKFIDSFRFYFREIKSLSKKLNVASNCYCTNLFINIRFADMVSKVSVANECLIPSSLLPSCVKFLLASYENSFDYICSFNFFSVC